MTSLEQPGTFMDHNVAQVPISDFINKELILFSMADNIRSIPSVVDGFKPGQRKVLFACFKRKLKAEIKVRQPFPGEQTSARSSFSLYDNRSDNSLDTSPSTRHTITETLRCRAPSSVSLNNSLAATT